MDESPRTLSTNPFKHLSYPTIAKRDVRERLEYLPKCPRCGEPMRRNTGKSLEEHREVWYCSQCGVPPRIVVPRLDGKGSLEFWAPRAWMGMPEIRPSEEAERLYNLVTAQRVKKALTCKWVKKVQDGASWLFCTACGLRCSHHMQMRPNRCGFKPKKGDR